MKDHCECPTTAKLSPMMAGLCDPVNELPFVNHKPGKCKCTNDLAKYKRGGKVLTLCSCCFRSTDRRISP